MILIHVLNPHVSRVLTFQHVISIKELLMGYFASFFDTKTFSILCVCCVDSTFQLRLRLGQCAVASRDSWLGLAGVAQDANPWVGVTDS